MSNNNQIARWIASTSGSQGTFRQRGPYGRGGPRSNRSNRSGRSGRSWRSNNSRRSNGSRASNLSRRSSGRRGGRGRRGRGRGGFGRGRGSYNGTIRQSTPRATTVAIQSARAGGVKPLGYVSGNINYLPSSSLVKRTLVYKKTFASRVGDYFDQASFSQGTWTDTKTIYAAGSTPGGRIVGVSVTFDPLYNTDFKGAVYFVAFHNSVTAALVDDHDKVVNCPASRTWSWPTKAFISSVIDTKNWDIDANASSTATSNCGVSVAVTIARIPQGVTATAPGLTFHITWLISQPA